MDFRLTFLTLSLPALLWIHPAMAERSVVSGQFTDSDDEIQRLNQPLCAEPGTLNYQIIGPLTASRSGTYQVRDAGNTPFSQDTILTWYSSMPNTNNLNANQIANVDDVGQVTLQSGRDYYLLAQPFCTLNADTNGVWGQHFDGPGLISGAQTIAAPDHWSGTWSNSDGATNTHPDPACPQTWYDVSGPHTIDRTDTWFVSITSAYDNLPIWFSIYRGSFDPDNPDTNEVAEGGGGAFFLEEGSDYYFVTQPFCDVLEGDWYYVMWPPGPFELNSGLSSTYYNPDTSGQGVLMDVDGDTGFVFGAWFTWAASGDSSLSRTEAVGNPSQRWLTMNGTFEPGDREVQLDLVNSTGGVFDNPAPVTNSTVGSATLNMESCESGTLSYQLDSGESGVTDMVRLIKGNVPYCHELTADPGVLFE